MQYVKFFETEAEAKQYQKEKGRGVLLKNTPRSRSRRDWEIAACAIGLPESLRQKMPYAVEYNI